MGGSLGSSGRTAGAAGTSGEHRGALETIEQAVQSGLDLGHLPAVVRATEVQGGGGQAGAYREGGEQEEIEASDEGAAATTPVAAVAPAPAIQAWVTR